MREVEPFSISLGTGQTATAARVPSTITPAEALAALGLEPAAGMIVMHGGALLDGDLHRTVVEMLEDGLAPCAARRGLFVADGGTYMGTMAAMGEARRRSGAGYPLIGVCPAEMVTSPGGPENDAERYGLDPGHSHFLLVEGGGFGIESELLVGLARAGGGPGVALIINGGDIVCREAQMHAANGTPIIVLRGSGRLADQLADPSSQERRLLPADAPIEVVDLGQPSALLAALDRFLGA
mgnify:CR=1 FL=1